MSKELVLTGEAAVLYAEQTARRLRVADVSEVAPGTLRKMLAAATARDRAEILGSTSIQVTAALAS